MIEQRQEIEYYQMQNPTFQAVDGDFTFTDDGGIFSTQTAEKNPETYRATNGLQAKVWSVLNAAFSRKAISISFQLKNANLQQKLNITEIPTKRAAVAGFAMLIDSEQGTYIQKTQDVTLSWATSPILASPVEPKDYNGSQTLLTQATAAFGLLASLLFSICF